MKHLAIFKGQEGEAILSGEKTMECRFSRAKTVPFGVIGNGDMVYIKPSGKDIIGQFRVKKVIFFDGIDEVDLEDIKKRYGKQLNVDGEYWEKNKNCRYGTIMFIGNCTRFITSPIKIKKSDLRGWVVLPARLAEAPAKRAGRQV